MCGRDETASDDVAWRENFFFVLSEVVVKVEVEVDGAAVVFIML